MAADSLILGVCADFHRDVYHAAQTVTSSSHPVDFILNQCELRVVAVAAAILTSSVTLLLVAPEFIIAEVIAIANDRGLEGVAKVASVYALTIAIVALSVCCVFLPARVITLLCLHQSFATLASDLRAATAPLPSPPPPPVLDDPTSHAPECRRRLCWAFYETIKSTRTLAITTYGHEAAIIALGQGPSYEAVKALAFFRWLEVAQPHGSREALRWQSPQGPVVLQPMSLSQQLVPSIRELIRLHKSLHALSANDRTALKSCLANPQAQVWLAPASRALLTRLEAVRPAIVNDLMHNVPPTARPPFACAFAPLAA